MVLSKTQVFWDVMLCCWAEGEKGKGSERQRERERERGIQRRRWGTASRLLLSDVITGVH